MRLIESLHLSLFYVVNFKLRCAAFSHDVSKSAQTRADDERDKVEGQRHEGRVDEDDASDKSLSQLKESENLRAVCRVLDNNEGEDLHI